MAPLYPTGAVSTVGQPCAPAIGTLSQEMMDMADTSTWRNKVGLAEMLRGGVIMDVTNPEQAKIAEDAGAVSVMAL